MNDKITKMNLNLNTPEGLSKLIEVQIKLAKIDECTGEEFNWVEILREFRDSASKPSHQSYAVWKDEKYGFGYGAIDQCKGRDIIEYCRTFDEAKALFKFHYYR